MILMAADTKADVEKYISNEYHPGLILLGKKGIGKSMIAEYIAKKLLETESLVNPDFLKIEAADGTIHIEQLEALHRRAKYCAVNAKQKVFLIDDADTMTVNAQNSLLKILEDGNATNIFIFVAHKPLLDTIHSRCITLKVNCPSYNEIKQFLNSKGEVADEVMIKIADNRLGVYYKLMADEKYVNDCKKIIKTLLSGQKRDLLSVFGVLTEKDQGCFYSYPTENVVMFVKYLKEIFAAALSNLFSNKKGNPEYSGITEKYSINSIVAIISFLQQHIERMNIKGQYSKNDFFDLVRCLMN